MSVTQVGVWAPRRAAGTVSRLTALTAKHHSLLSASAQSPRGLFEIGIFTASPVRLIGKSFLLSQLCGDCLSGDYSFLHCCLPVIVPYYRQTRAREAAKCTKLQENFASYTPTTEKQAFPKGAFPFPSAAAINYKD